MSGLSASFSSRLAQEHILAPIHANLEELNGKIRGLATKIIPALFSGHFFSSHEFYETAEVTLLCSSFIGIIGSLGLFITGMPLSSALLLALSVSTALGAYLASQASLQQTLIESANQMREQTEILAEENRTLKETVGKLSMKISQFDLQLAHLNTLNREFQKELLFFRISNEKNMGLFTKKIEDFSSQISAFETLWNELLKNMQDLKSDTVSSVADLRKIIEELTNPKLTLLLLEEHKKIREQIREELAHLKEIKQQLNEINRQIALREGQVKERDDVLRELRDEHSQILTSYTEQLRQFIEQNWILKSLLDKLKKS